jgi:hypothetical protein
MVPPISLSASLPNPAAYFQLCAIASEPTATLRLRLCEFKFGGSNKRMAGGDRGT